VNIAGFTFVVLLVLLALCLLAKNDWLLKLPH